MHRLLPTLTLFCLLGWLVGSVPGCGRVAFGPYGPADSSEKLSPGPIDPQASKEFTTTKSGLRYRILRKTEGKMPTHWDQVVVHYKGWLDNGTVFDSSYRKGKTSTVSLTNVIDGWTEGLQLVNEGGMIELEVPPDLAYGSEGKKEAKIAPYSTLHFIVEAVEVIQR